MMGTHFRFGNELVTRNGWLSRNMDRVLSWCERKGWEPAPSRTFGDEIALLHSELSEALEAYRDHGFEDATEGRDWDEDPAKPEGVGSELADVLVRLLHTCVARGIDLEWEFERKMRYNENRTHRHGGKRL